MVVCELEKEINVSKKIGQKIREIRQKKGISQLELANLVDTSQSHIANIEAGRRRIPFEVLERIAKALGVSVAEIVEEPDESQPPPLDRIAKKVILLPVVASVRAGSPGEPLQFRYTEKYYPYYEKLPCKENECFVLEVHGDSMFPTLHDGDYILVKKIESFPVRFPENFKNKVVVAANENWEYTIKRLKEINGKYFLVPDNPLYQIQEVDGFKVVGVALERLPKPEKL